MTASLPDEPWAPDKRWTSKQTRGFLLYRDADPATRSLQRVTDELGHRDPSLVRRWSRDLGWVARVAAWDREQDRVRRDAMVRELEEVARRQARQLEAAQLALAQPITALLEKVQAARRAGQDPFGDMTAGDLLRDVAAAARAFPSLVQAERLVRGLSTANVDAHLADGRSTDDARTEAEAATRADLEAMLAGRMGRALPAGPPAGMVAAEPTTRPQEDVIDADE